MQETHLKICLLNLGCKVNQYEMDALSGSLADEFEVCSRLENADIFILNTCAVTGEAERKSRQMVTKIIKINPAARIFVCGCASQKNAEQFAKIPQVQCVLGTFGKGKLKEYFGKDGIFTKEFSREYEDDFFSTGVRTRGYIKIQDGCNNFCSYCIIPFLRGRSRSRSLESIVAEATELSQTCSEIVLTGINISDFKLNGKSALASVLFALKDLKTRLRLSSLEAGVITEDFLKTAQSLANFCPHFHLSLQSGSDKVLKDMNRHYTTDEFFEKVKLIRSFFPAAAITTDIIVGFPTETDEEFEKTLRFVEKVAFSDVHIFAYSPREGTASAKLTLINGAVIKKREQTLKALVQDSKKAFLKSWLAKPLEVLFETNLKGINQGFSREYIRCYLPSQKDFSSQTLSVRPVELFKDGLKVEKID